MDLQHLFQYHEPCIYILKTTDENDDDNDNVFMILVALTFTFFEKFLVYNVLLFLLVRAFCYFQDPHRL